MVKEVVQLSYCAFETSAPGTAQGGAFSMHPLEISDGFSPKVNLSEDFLRFVSVYLFTSAGPRLRAGARIQKDLRTLQTEAPDVFSGLTTIASPTGSSGSASDTAAADPATTPASNTRGTDAKATAISHHIKHCQVPCGDQRRLISSSVSTKNPIHVEDVTISSIQMRQTGFSRNTQSVKRVRVVEEMGV
ncbi:unnamed protein product [Mesocestoides corti]|uniref:Uncharacterized protein n=1 Tax=Mesocestoides corti TaxID=53468 RepID=A0A0R3U3U0_MESCO|nr:unnamed protein product [Mesocestoides corti]